MTHDEDPIDRLKEQLRLEILALVGGWDQYIAARSLGTDQPRMSNLHRGRLERFSLEKLIRFLANIDRRVDVTVVNVGRGSLRMFRFPPRSIPQRYAKKENSVLPLGSREVTESPRSMTHMDSHVQRN